MATAAPACNFGDEAYCHTLDTVRRIVGALSVVGCLSLLACIVLYKRWRHLSERMILYLTVAALLDATIYLASNSMDSEGYCIFSAWLMQFSDGCLLAWTCAQVVFLYNGVIRKTRGEAQEKFYHLVCWGLPLVLSIIPFFGEYYGPAGAWCWIKHDYYGARLAIWYIPLFLSITVMTAVMGVIIFRVFSRSNQWRGLDPNFKIERQLMRDHIRPVIAYPIAYLILSVPGLINRLQNAGGGDPVFALYLVQVISAPLVGVVNAGIYGYGNIETLKNCSPGHCKELVAGGSGSVTVTEFEPDAALDPQQYDAVNESDQSGTSMEQ